MKEKRNRKPLEKWSKEGIVRKMKEMNKIKESRNTKDYTNDKKERKENNKNKNISKTEHAKIMNFRKSQSFILFIYGYFFNHSSVTFQLVSPSESSNFVGCWYFKQSSAYKFLSICHKVITAKLLAVN